MPHMSACFYPLTAPQTRVVDESLVVSLTRCALSDRLSCEIGVIDVLRAKMASANTRSAADTAGASCIPQGTAQTNRKSVCAAPEPLRSKTLRAEPIVRQRAGAARPADRALSRDLAQVLAPRTGSLVRKALTAHRPRPGGLKVGGGRCAGIVGTRTSRSPGSHSSASHTASRTLNVTLWMGPKSR